MNSKSIYIHIPFCISKCDYCDFFSVQANGIVPDEYIAALKNELDWYTSFYNIDSYSTVYIGGGTPSILSRNQLANLLGFVAPRLGKCKEFTIEMNPETVTAEKLEVARDFGINRLSVGIQSFNEPALKAVHRHCSISDIERSLGIIDKTWNGLLNLDVIAGLPSQSSGDFVKSLEKVLSYNPDHLSLYTLTIEEGTALSKRISDGESWNGDAADDDWMIGRDILLANGFRQYEVSNFCKPGMESIHNMTYWKQNDYIGIGSGATGTVYNFKDNQSGIRWTNTDAISEYIEYWNNPGKITEISSSVRFVESLPIEVEEEEFFMMGLRTAFGVSEKEYARRFSKMAPYYGNIKLRLEPILEKLVAINDEEGNACYSLYPDNILFLNSILMEL